jgi:hypothetical protein
MAPYEPKPEDLHWARNMLALLQPRGVWASSEGVYQVDKDAKTLTRIGEIETPIQLLLHHRTQCVFGQLGYTVYPIINWERNTSDRLPPACRDIWDYWEW